MGLQRFLILLTLMVSTLMGSAQHISSHQWNDRLVIVLTTDSQNQIYLKQLSELQVFEEGLKERKIIVYQSLPSRFRVGLSLDASWKASDNVYKQLKKSDAEFEIILIGLDGGIKLRKEQWVAAEELFALIDRMPMRRAEMRRKKGQ